MKKSIFFGIVVMAIVAVFFSCNLQSDQGLITIKIADNVKAIMPDGSLDAALYAVHGTGTSGEALGGSFDIEINPASPSAVLDLKPGVWDILVTVWNNDTPSVAVGSGAATITVLSATPQTVSITCLPYSGPGDLVIDLEWFPDVVVTPSAEAEVKALGGYYYNRRFLRPRPSVDPALEHSGR